MDIRVLIPTCKTRVEVAPQVCELEGFLYGTGVTVYATCLQESAAANRNAALRRCNSGDVVIMIDDDIYGFYAGWHSDLIRPLLTLPDHLCPIVVSARLLKSDGSFATMMFKGETEGWLSVVPRVPTAAIAFIWDGHTRFDEAYIGSGFEDDDFLAQLYLQYPLRKTAINNECRLIHANEMKNQGGKYWDTNKAHFETKWLTRNERRYNLSFNIPSVFWSDDPADIIDGLETKSPSAVHATYLSRSDNVSDEQYRAASMMRALGTDGGWYAAERIAPAEMLKSLEPTEGLIVSVGPDGLPDGNLIAMRCDNPVAFAFRNMARIYATKPLTGVQVDVLTAALRAVLADAQLSSVCRTVRLDQIPKPIAVPTSTPDRSDEHVPVEAGDPAVAGKGRRPANRRKLQPARVEPAGTEEAL